MAGKGAVALDKVVINIESGVGNTHKNIDKLATSLEKLKKSISGGFNNIHKLSVGIQELNKAAKALPNTINNLKTIGKIVKPLNRLGEIVKPSGLISTINALEKIPKVFKTINPKSLENVSRVSSQLASALSPVSDKLSKIGNGFSALSSLAKTYGVQITRVSSGSSDAAEQIGNVYSSLRLMGKVFSVFGRVNISVISDLDKAFDKMNHKIKLVGLALLGTRTAFTAIRKAVSEYMALDQQLAKETQNLWRALGAQLVPAVEAALYVFKQIIRVIYSVIYALTGIDLIAKANAKALDSMSSSAADALGNLQKFDDLNVANFNEDKDKDNLIKLEKIDLTPIQEIIDWMKRLKTAVEDAWKNGGWNNVAKVLADGINGAANSIDAKAIGAAIGRGILGALDFIDTLIENADFSKLGTRLGDIVRNMPWKEIWKSVVDTAIEALKNLDDFMDGLFNFSGAGEIYLLYKFGKKFTDVLTKSDTIRIFTSLITNSDKLIGKFDILRTKADDIWDAFEMLGKGVLPEMVGETMNVSTGFAKILSPLASLATKIGGLFGGSFAAGAITVIAGIVVLVLALVEAFKNLYNNNKEFKETFDELMNGIKETGLKIFGALKVAVEKVIGVLENIWKNVITPLFDLLVSIVEPFLKAIIEILNVLWKNVVSPLANFLMDVFAIAIDAVVWAFDLLIAILNPVIKIFQWLWDKILEPIVGFLLDVFVVAIEILGIAFKGVVADIEKTLKGLWNIVKWIINGIIDMAEGLVNGIITGLNFLIIGINKIGFDVPDWVPEIGGKKFGFDLKYIEKISLPKLETGTNEVPYEGIYHLHQGEAVVPKKYNPALGNGTDEELGQKLDTLISIMGNMNFTNVVNIGNETLYKKQQRYNKMQNDKYGTTVNL